MGSSDRPLQEDAEHYQAKWERESLRFVLALSRGRSTKALAFKSNQTQGGALNRPRLWPSCIY